jgi:hypothetical protein
MLLLARCSHCTALDMLAIEMRNQHCAVVVCFVLRCMLIFVSIPIHQYEFQIKIYLANRFICGGHAVQSLLLLRLAREW